MKIRIFDIECDNLLDKVTKIYCLSYFDLQSKTFETLTSYKDIINIFKEDCVWTGHNIIRYDLSVLKKILNIDPPKFVIDTLPLSWYLYPERKKHGLEEWGNEFGIKKPEIKDWQSLSIEEYSHRCEEDVKINTKLWNNQKRFLDAIYKDDNLLKFLEYIHFKITCVKRQEEIGLILDIPHIKSCVEKWTTESESKNTDLQSVMPKVAKKKTKSYANAATLNGNTFTKGDLFYESAVNSGATTEVLKKLSKIVDWEDPNSGSFKQIKDWLDNLGWIPEHIKHVRNKETNEVKLIPQIKSKFDEGELCQSVVKLFEKEPKLELLQGLFVLTHRIAIMEGFLKEQKEGKIYPSIGGLTNTLRLKHKVVVNLPAIYKPYGKDIRSSIISSQGYTLIGADLSNIEDKTKRHYIHKYDPKYVEDMNVKGYDAHLELGLLAGFLKQDDIDFYKEFEKKKEDKSFLPLEEDKIRFDKLKQIRNKSKVTNFSATYKVGAEALARNAGIKLSEAKKLLKIYWDRNSAILDVENECKIREVNNTRWLLNPISGFWYSLRNDKDKFSTLNQGSAVFIFDMWLKEQIELGINIPFQYHDEDLLCVLNEDVNNTKLLIEQAIKKVNEKYPLNVSITCSIETGNKYSETH